MLTITIFAAGLVCLAGVLGLRLVRAQAQISTAPAQAHADERGITLQTLIVTAVLVLMAVAAGVVIVAITNNAAEDLEQSAPNLESECNQVEVFDPVLAATGEKGRAGTLAAGVDGSVDGCIPVCIWQGGGSAGDKLIAPDELSFNRNFKTDLVGAKGTALANTDVRAFVSPTKLMGADIATVEDDDYITTGKFENQNIAEVRVIPAQSECGVYNSDEKLIWHTGLPSS